MRTNQPTKHKKLKKNVTSSNQIKKGMFNIIYQNLIERKKPTVFSLDLVQTLNTSTYHPWMWYQKSGKFWEYVSHILQFEEKWSQVANRQPEGKPRRNSVKTHTYHCCTSAGTENDHQGSAVSRASLWIWGKRENTERKNLTHDLRRCLKVLKRKKTSVLLNSN